MIRGDWQRFCNRLGCRVPIIQAPIGSIAGVDLARAVAGAGGLPILGLTWTPAKTASAMVNELVQERALVGVNFALHFEPTALPAVLEQSPQVVTFSWGQPGSLIHQCHEAGALVGVQVAEERGAVRALSDGADLIIVQGVEAGGHVQGHFPLDEVLPRVRQAIGDDALLVTAGGLTDGADVARVINAGANAAMLGTRFVATDESLASAEYKNALVQGEQTCLTSCFDRGWPNSLHRVLPNNVLLTWLEAGCTKPGMRPNEGIEVGLSSKGEPILVYEDTAPRQGMAGNLGEMALYAGTGVGRIQSIVGAGELVESLWEETRQSLKRS